MIVSKTFDCKRALAVSFSDTYYFIGQHFNLDNWLAPFYPLYLCNDISQKGFHELQCLSKGASVHGEKGLLGFLYLTDNCGTVTDNCGSISFLIKLPLQR